MQRLGLVSKVKVENIIELTCVLFKMDISLDFMKMPTLKEMSYFKYYKVNFVFTIQN